MNKKVKGVFWNKEKKKWVGHLSITINGEKKKFFKYFNSYEEAKEYRNYLEEQYFGIYKYSEE